MLYSLRFSRRAQVFDASAEAIDPLLMKYRGRNPLVLVPMRNASNAGTLVAVASAISAPGVSRVMLMTVVRPPDTWKGEEQPESLLAAQTVLREAMTASFAAGLAPEALMSVSANHWEEIERVARLHRCESLLLGLRNVNEHTADPQLDRLLSTIPCDVVVLRAAAGWSLDGARRILVPVGGQGLHSPLRARLLGSLRRLVRAQTTYLSVLPPSASQSDVERAQQQLRICVEDEMDGNAEIVVETHADPAELIIQLGADHDLIVLGLQQLEQRKRIIGDFTLRIARGTQCALVILGHKPRP
jgi:APA family basic amino acid/polyamine antiporter